MTPPGLDLELVQAFKPEEKKKVPVGEITLVAVKPVTKNKSASKIETH